jgi:uncharacterized protein YdiU (UPF0061 family)
MRGKLGLFNDEPEDAALIDELLSWMQEQQADFTQTFRRLASSATQSDPVFSAPSFLEWDTRWKQRRTRQSQSPQEVQDLMFAHNPRLIPRNHKVEEALTAASEEGNLAPLTQLLDVLASPYAPDKANDTARACEYESPPPANQGVYQTFCGT